MLLAGGLTAAGICDLDALIIDVQNNLGAGEVPRRPVLGSVQRSRRRQMCILVTTHKTHVSDRYHEFIQRWLLQVSELHIKRRIAGVSVIAA